MFNEDLDFLKNKAEELKKLADIDLDDLTYEEIMSEFGLDLKQLEDDMMNSRTKLPLGFVKLHPDAITPKYNYDSDSGFDLHSVEDITIEPFGRALVPSGLSFDIKDGYEIQVRTKSGLAINQGLMVLNSPGTVDNGYTGWPCGVSEIPNLQHSQLSGWAIISGEKDLPMSLDHAKAIEPPSAFLPAFLASATRRLSIQVANNLPCGSTASEAKR